MPSRSLPVTPRGHRERWLARRRRLARRTPKGPPRLPCCVAALACTPPTEAAVFRSARPRRLAPPAGSPRWTCASRRWLLPPRRVWSRAAVHRAYVPLPRRVAFDRCFGSGPQVVSCRRRVCVVARPRGVADFASSASVGVRRRSSPASGSVSDLDVGSPPMRARSLDARPRLSPRLRVVVSGSARALRPKPLRLLRGARCPRTLPRPEGRRWCPRRRVCSSLSVRCLASPLVRPPTRGSVVSPGGARRLERRAPRGPPAVSARSAAS